MLRLNSLPPEASAVHHITGDMLVGKPSAYAALPPSYGSLIRAPVESARVRSIVRGYYLRFLSFPQTL